MCFSILFPLFAKRRNGTQSKRAKKKTHNIKKVSRAFPAKLKNLCSFKLSLSNEMCLRLHHVSYINKCSDFLANLGTKIEI